MPFKWQNCQDEKILKNIFLPHSECPIYIVSPSFIPFVWFLQLPTSHKNHSTFHHASSSLTCQSTLQIYPPKRKCRPQFLCFISNELDLNRLLGNRPLEYNAHISFFLSIRSLSTSAFNKYSFIYLFILFVQFSIEFASSSSSFTFELLR